MAEKPFALPGKEIGYLWDRGNHEPSENFKIWPQLKRTRLMRLARAKMKLYQIQKLILELIGVDENSSTLT